MVGIQLPGDVFGQYEIREQIGRGGMGIVYRAYQKSLNREVAIKILSDVALASAKDLKRFQYEAQTAATLEHPHIVPVYDFGSHNGVSFVAMRLLTGGSLALRIESFSSAQPTPMPLDEILQITVQLASALDYAHRKGVIHRDIKPSNILFDEHDVPYIVDFGIAKVIYSGTSITSSDEFVGTLPYVAPDQLRNPKVTPAADQYSLAVTVYRMLTGRLPHEADTLYEIIHKRLYESPVPLRMYRPDLPEVITQVVNRALENEPTKRYENVSAFATALYEAALQDRHLQHSELLKPPTIGSRTALKKQLSKPPPTIPAKAKPAPPSAEPMTPAAQPRRLRLLFAAIVLLLIILGVLWALGQNPSGSLQAASTGTNLSQTDVVLTETGAAPCRVRLTERAYIRSGPGTEYDVIRAYDAGWTTVVAGRTSDAAGNGWWYVGVPSLNTNYWVADAVTEEFGDCGAVPLVP